MTRPTKAGITKQQCSDTGMAFVLILLLLRVFMGRPIFLTAAIVVLVVNMTAPQLFRPLAVVWFGLSHFLGSIVSRILLTAVFVLVVTPVAWVRRVAGKDALKLRVFRRGTGSVMVVRNHQFSAKDLERPY